MRRLNSLLEHLARQGVAPCLCSGGRWHSYADLVSAIDVWRGRLGAYGLEPGAVVGLQADYSADAVALMLAAWSRGLVLALVPRGSDPDPYLADAYAAGCFAFPTSGGVCWQPRACGGRSPLLDRLAACREAGLIIFTSGSSGRAKAALHSVERFLQKYERRGRALRTLAFLQFDHIAGIDTLLYTLSAGGELVFVADRDPRTICEAVAAVAVEVLPTSPSFLRLLWASGAAPDYDMSSLSVVTYGSEPMDAATLKRAHELFPHARIAQKYGTTETGAPRTVSRPGDSRWVQIGGHGVETRIVDGILWIRGAGTLLGYLNADLEISEDGWYCTGDRVERDGSWIRILGRDSDMINVGGEKVSPAEIEAVILELDQIESVAVSGRSQPLMGQIVTARVKLRPNVRDVGIEGLVRRHCRTRLPRYKVPVTVDTVQTPLSSSRQKVIRRQ